MILLNKKMGCNECYIKKRENDVDNNNEIIAQKCSSKFSNYCKFNKRKIEIYSDENNESKYNLKTIDTKDSSFYSNINSESQIYTKAPDPSLILFTPKFNEINLKKNSLNLSTKERGKILKNLSKNFNGKNTDNDHISNIGSPIIYTILGE